MVVIYSRMKGNLVMNIIDAVDKFKARKGRADMIRDLKSDLVMLESEESSELANAYNKSTLIHNSVRVATIYLGIAVYLVYWFKELI